MIQTSLKTHSNTIDITTCSSLKTTVKWILSFIYQTQKKFQEVIHFKKNDSIAQMIQFFHTKSASKCLEMFDKAIMADFHECELDDTYLFHLF